MNIKIIRDTILILDDGVKENVIKEFRGGTLLNIKFMTLNEFRDRYYFKYDEMAIYYLINKYHYKYDVACKYLANLYYAGDYDYGSNKLRKLIDLKHELTEAGALYYDKQFRESLCDRDIIFYHFKHFTKWDLLLKDSLAQITNVSIIFEDTKEYKHDFIYRLASLDDEVNFVAGRICDLINRGVVINKIKLCGIDDSYINTVKKIFGIYHIPIYFDIDTLYNTKIGKDFLVNLNSDVNVTFKYLEEHYNLLDECVRKIYNSLIKLVNKYVWVDDITTVREMLVNDMKVKKINVVSHMNKIEVIDNLSCVSDDDYDNFKEKYLYEINKLNLEKENLTRKKINSYNLNWINKFKNTGKLDKLDRNIINSFIENIYVGNNKDVEIVFRFKDQYKVALEYLKKEKYVL